MSRIDEALKRLAGAATPEPRNTPQVLDRFASEGEVPRVDDPKRVQKVDGRRLPTVVPGPHPVEVRSVAPKSPTEASVHPTEVESEPEEEKLIDVRQLVDYAGFVLRSVRRHMRLALATVVLVLAATGATLAILPRTYHVETRLLAQRNAVMTALSNPNRAVPWDADAPTRAAAETVLRRDNLIALITQTDLIRHWKRTRAPILKVKDWLVSTASGHVLTPDEELDALIDMLEARMKVAAGPVGDGTVTIELDWPDAEMAYRLVQDAQQAFLEARQAAESAAIGESITILERYSSSLHQDINRTLSELQRTAPKGPRPAIRRNPRPRDLGPAVPTIAETLGMPQVGGTFETDPELSKLKTTLSAKRTELARIEAERQRQVSEVQGKLAQLRTVYTPNHPSVLSAQQNLAAVSQESQQTMALAAEIEELQADYDRRVADATDAQIKSQLAPPSAPRAPAVAVAPAPQLTEPAAEPAATDRFASPTSEFAALRLRSELNQLESILERTDSARIELAVSQAAFKYRYTVIRPAQVPRNPTFPRWKEMMVVGFIASLMLALVVVVGKDLLSDRILESWQIERRLNLPVLGTLRVV
jgi:uncharacterized protein involved in exopolysaccharide biosynthesis